MAPNHLKFAAIQEDRFLAGTCVLSVLETIGRSNLKKQFRRDCGKFLEDSLNCVVSTVAARSLKGQGLSCFYHLITVDGENHAPKQIFDMFFDGLLEKGCARGAEMESFLQEQRQLERTSNRNRPDVRNVFTFCSPQVGFRMRFHLYKVCIVFKIVVYSLAATSCSFLFCFTSLN